MSTTIIDALLVTFGLDASNFKKGAEETGKAQKKITDQAGKSAAEIEKTEKKLSIAQATRAKELEARSKQIAQGFSKVRNEALSLLAVFTAGVGLKNFVENTVDGAVNLGFLSANLNMSTEQITAWQRAAERAGGTSAGMTAQLKESAAEIARLKSGMGASEGMQWFFRMGGSADDLKDGNTYLLARSKIIAGIFKTDPTKAALMASQMGISEDQFNLIKQGQEAIQSLVSAQMRHAAISKEDAATMLVLKNKYSDFKDTVSDVSQSIIVKLAPTFEKILDQLNKLAIWVEDHKDDIKAWLDATIPKVEKLFKSFADGNFDSNNQRPNKNGQSFR